MKTNELWAAWEWQLRKGEYNRAPVHEALCKDESSVMQKEQSTCGEHMRPLGGIMSVWIIYGRLCNHEIRTQLKKLVGDCGLIALHCHWKNDVPLTGMDTQRPEEGSICRGQALGWDILCCWCFCYYILLSVCCNVIAHQPTDLPHISDSLQHIISHLIFEIYQI